MLEKLRLGEAGVEVGAAAEEEELLANHRKNLAKGKTCRGANGSKRNNVKSHPYMSLKEINFDSIIVFMPFSVMLIEPKHYKSLDP